MDDNSSLATNPNSKGRATRSTSSALLPTFLGEGSPTKIDYRTKGTLILTSLLEDLGKQIFSCRAHTRRMCRSPQLPVDATF